MYVSTAALSMVLALSTGEPSLASASTQNGLPPHHPPVRMHPTLERFSSQFKCPYAKEWLTKGAQQAAIDLGLTTPEKVKAALEADAQNQDGRAHTRRALQQAASASMGSCSFVNPWSGPSCMEFRGEGWTEASMADRCASEQDSTWSSEGCPQPDELAGWCLSENSPNAIEATSMMVSAASDCAGNQMACQTFVGGAWEAAAGCGGGAVPEETSMGGPPAGMDFANMGPPSGDGTCLLAPGAIGAAHQSGFSQGYSSTCPGTPAEGSPYMWPMAWGADVDTQSLAFGVDDVVHRTNGRTFYRLDKNWKRTDTLFSKGVRRGIGQGPCEDIDESQSMEGIVACRTDMDVARGDPMETMIHKGNKMYFIVWKNDTTTDVKVGERDPSLIEDCMYMDLMVIGNIRPDWYLDDRGDDTDVQYLGDQHVYYASGDIPRLVKQWRKKDFASQYFTMSVAGNPPRANATETESIHWPLVLNIPGEGFGDDMLQVYQNHALLTDEDDDLFELVENLEASGGSCPLLTTGMGSDGEGDGRDSFGPPVTEVHVPSNLEVDENSWFKNVYTFSPVWQPPMKIDESMNSAGASGKAVTEAGRVTVESCYDPTSKSVELTVEFQDIEAIPTENGSQLPWMALGYRPTDLCAMTPLDGSDTKMILVSQSPRENVPKAYVGSMGPQTKNFNSEAITSIYDTLWPLEQTMDYSGVALVAPMLGMMGETSSSPMIQRSTPVQAKSPTSVVLSFRQKFDEKPDVMHLMYAIGMSTQLGVHTSRSCFEVEEFPTCAETFSSDGSGFATPPGQPVAREPSASATTDSESTISAATTAISEFGMALASFAALCLAF